MLDLFAGVCTHRSGAVLIFNLEVAHGFDDSHDGLDGVTEDHRSILFALFLRVAVLMDNPGEHSSFGIYPVYSLELFRLLF